MKMPRTICGDPQCSIKNKQMMDRKYREEHREEIRAYQKKYMQKLRKENPEKIRAYARRRYCKTRNDPEKWKKRLAEEKRWRKKPERMAYYKAYQHDYWINVQKPKLERERKH